jgi:O-methyltransferase involved in polyketide biosynthesis
MSSAAGGGSLTREAVAATLRQVAALAAGSTPAEMLALARDAGFKEARHVAGTSHVQRYFAGRADGLRPSSGEDFVIATT